MPGSTTAAGAWFTLRRRTTIYPPEPAGRPGICAVCRGPARIGYARCYQCAQHDLLGPGLLADAVVPTGSGRPGPHPLLDMAGPYLRLPRTGLAIRPGEQGRDPNPDRFTAERSGPGAVLLLDDSWVSGASAQSAAAALKRAGARHVAVVVLGRHVDPADRLSAPLAARLAARGYDPDRCAVHPVSAHSGNSVALNTRCIE